jgi:hypothetical protein
MNFLDFSTLPYTSKTHIKSTTTPIKKILTIRLLYFTRTIRKYHLLNLISFKIKKILSWNHLYYNPLSFDSDIARRLLTPLARTQRILIIIERLLLNTYLRTASKLYLLEY